MNYTTYYTIAEQMSRGWLPFLPGLLFSSFWIAIGIVLRRARIRQAVGRNHPVVWIAVGLMFVGATLLAYINDVRTLAIYQEANRLGSYVVVEGCVRDFVPRTSLQRGSPSESFTIDETTFSYTGISSYGFNQTAAQGGPIHNGLRVRIRSFDQIILQLEIAEQVSCNAIREYGGPSIGRQQKLLRTSQSLGGCQPACTQ